MNRTRNGLRTCIACGLKTPSRAPLCRECQQLPLPEIGEPKPTQAEKVARVPEMCRRAEMGLPLFGG